MLKRSVIGISSLFLLLIGFVIALEIQSKNQVGEETVTKISAIEIDGPIEQLLDESQIIVAGVVSEELPGFYTNPKGDQISAETGEKITNAWETDYLVKVTKVYKGEPYSTDTIRVKTWNRIGLPPIEEGTFTCESDEPEFYLEAGKPCVLCLAYSEESTLNTGDFGYEVVWRDRGYFLTGAEGVYQSTSFEMKEADIAKKAAAAEGYMERLSKSETPSIFNE